MEQIRPYRSRVHKHGPLQRILRKPGTYIRTEAVEARLSGMEPDGLLRVMRPVDRQPLALLRWVRFQHRPQGIEGSGLECPQRKEAFEVSLYANVHKRRSFLDETPHITGQEPTVGLLRDVCLQARQFPLHLAPLSKQPPLAGL